MDVSERLARQGIYVPPSGHGKPPKWRCNFPGCDALFTEDQDQQRVRHMAGHAKDADEIQTMNARRRSEQDHIFGEGDPEKAAYLKKRFKQLVGKVANPFDPRHY
jgi:hypothetical protein